MKKTAQFGLNQWEMSDRIQMDDFNADNAKIEAALGTKLGKKLLLDYTTEEETSTVEVPLTGVDWGSCAVAVIKIIPSEAQEKPDGLWVYFGSSSYQGKCRSIVMGTTYDYFAEASLSGENLIFLFVGHNSNRHISGITFYSSDVYACSFNYSFSEQTVLKIYNRGSAKTAAGTKIQIWGIA